MEPRGHIIDCHGLTRLTERELSILQLLAQGLTNGQIGARLHISRYTVAQHVADLLKRTATRTRAHLVAHAYECGRLP